MFASENGLKVTVEDAKCVQANAFIQAGIFQEFKIKEEPDVVQSFKINLNVLLVRCFWIKKKKKSIIFSRENVIHSFKRNLAVKFNLNKLTMCMVKKRLKLKPR